ncbi:calpain-1 catalytic subunit-like [Rhinatrema bivittatum]|uniref:calpain-1 catalytic subunit-like n=1 Tax=Rhinatrema bivittatum TaxID=194408 RepID=UPI001128BC37|nr:calpain-1 catalytic subunit-like [Rhinatrema bivittatum]
MAQSGITIQLLRDTSLTSVRGTQVIPYLNQRYVELKQKCLQQGWLFRDESFPAGTASLGCELASWSEVAQGVEWKRPQEICNFPQFICKDMSRTDIQQGQLGNCWFLAATASLSLYPQLMARVVPSGQSFQQDYAGIFHFQFWQYGTWVDVVIDDHLPVKDGKLLFVHSAQRNEFWAALLEKAYAKLNGSYEALNDGFMNEAFVDFTGGIDEHIDLKVPNPGLFRIIQRAVQKKSLMGASIEISMKEEMESQTPEGLIRGHAYSVTGVSQVLLGGRNVQLLRLRNPWGLVEWKGRWSDYSPLWSNLDPLLRERLHVRAEDGEFWMQLDDFLRFFDMLEICNLTPDSLQDDRVERWTTSSYQGAWVRGFNAGGCLNNIGTFWTNPQFQVMLQEKDDDKESCTLLVSLMQRNRRQEKSLGRDFLAIGFEIFKVHREFADTKFTSQRKAQVPFLKQVKNSQYVSLRNITARYELEPGQYLIVPTTFSPMQESKFTLRIFTEKQQTFMEVDDEISAEAIAFQEAPSVEIDKEFELILTRAMGEDMQLSPLELQKIMNKTMSKYVFMKSDGFSLDSCQEMVCVMDSRNGKLDLETFKKLWNKIKLWEHIFITYDQDRNGTMSTYELRLALEGAGFHLNNKLMKQIIRKYGDRWQQVAFDRFLSCLAWLENIFRKCKTLDRSGSGVIGLTYHKWMQLAAFS